MTPAARQPRRPLLALFAGLLLPGLGHVYAGDPARGTGWLLSVALPVPAAAWLALHGPRALMSLLMLAGVTTAFACYVASIKSAYRLTRLPSTSPPGPWNRAHVYLACFVLGHLLVLSPLAGLTRDHLVETFKVPSASMIPALLPGDRFFADKRVGHRGGPRLRRGDIAVFVYPNDRTSLYVKRVVGLPGDRVEIDGRQVKVNGTSIVGAELHALGSPELDRQLTDHRAFRETLDGRSYVALWRQGVAEPLATVVPNGQVFVLGDNRDESRDSRRFGTLPLVDVTGVATQVWLSESGESGWRVRRTGKIVE